MSDLVFKGENNQVLTNSLLVAKEFGKVHAKVMRDIENLNCSEEFRLANFGNSSFKNEQGKEFPMFTMTKDGFSFLVMGYTGKKHDAVLRDIRNLLSQGVDAHNFVETSYICE